MPIVGRSLSLYRPHVISNCFHSSEKLARAWCALAPNKSDIVPFGPFHLLRYSRMLDRLSGRRAGKTRALPVLGRHYRTVFRYKELARLPGTHCLVPRPLLFLSCVANCTVMSRNMRAAHIKYVYRVRAVVILYGTTKRGLRNSSQLAIESARRLEHIGIDSKGCQHLNSLAIRPREAGQSLLIKAPLLSSTHFRCKATKRVAAAAVAEGCPSPYVRKDPCRCPSKSPAATIAMIPQASTPSVVPHAALVVPVFCLNVYEAMSSNAFQSRQRCWNGPVVNEAAATAEYAVTARTARLVHVM